MVPCEGTVIQGIDFLTCLYNEDNLNRRYSAINTARSALSSVLPIRNGKTFGKEELVISFMKGVFNLRPPKAKYTNIWDPEKVLDRLKLWGPTSRLPLYQLSQKTAMLFLLATGIRGHTLLGAQIDKMQITENQISFVIDRSFYKQNRHGWTPKPVVLKMLKENKEMCPCSTLKAYLEKTKPIRNNQNPIFLTTRGEHRPISRATLRRWIIEVLADAGIDTVHYGSGSTRSAATSKALAEGAPLDTILSSGGWSRESTFQKFYARPIGSNILTDYVLN